MGSWRSSHSYFFIFVDHRDCVCRVSYSANLIFHVERYRCELADVFIHTIVLCCVSVSSDVSNDDDDGDRVTSPCELNQVKRTSKSILINLKQRHWLESNDLAPHFP